jgi:hypothetical protein
VTTAELADLGLPVRVRQANLAPQLRDAPAPATPITPGQDGDGQTGLPGLPRRTPSASGMTVGMQFGAAAGGDEQSSAADQQAVGESDNAQSPAASPEEAARNTMSALQRGWQLGRAGAAFAENDETTKQPASEPDKDD